jgi:hypothetical protein
LGGTMTVLLLYAIGWRQTGEFSEYRLLQFHPIVWGLAASLALGVLVSLVTRPPDEARLAQLFDAPGESLHRRN